MSTQEEKLLIAVSRLRNVLFRDLDAVFSSNGLTITQFAVLEALYNKGSLNVGDIQRLILGTSGNVPLVIKNLEKESLVSRKKSEKDGRISIIELTEKGHNLVAKVYPLQQKRLLKLFENVDEHDKQSTIDLLQRIYNTVTSVIETDKNEKQTE